MANFDSRALAPHVKHLLARARRLTRNDHDACDLVQETCLQALEALARGATPPEDVRRWLFVVMRNLWFNVVRHERICAVARAELVLGDRSDSGLCEARVVRRQLERAWSELSPQARTIAQQCLIEGDSHEDVSRRFGITPGGVATSIHRTREALRARMFEDRCAA